MRLSMSSETLWIRFILLMESKSNMLFLVIFLTNITIIQSAWKRKVARLIKSDGAGTGKIELHGGAMVTISPFVTHKEQCCG